MMENFHDRKIKKVVSDRGGEFMSKDFQALAKNSGFIHVLLPPETPEHNAFAEWANRTILYKARCLLQGSNLPRSYWGEAVNTAVFLSNLTPSASRKTALPIISGQRRLLGSKTVGSLGVKRTFPFRNIVGNGSWDPLATKESCWGTRMKPPHTEFCDSETRRLSSLGGIIWKLGTKTSSLTVRRNF